MDHIFAMKQVIEKIIEKDKVVNAVFVDLGKPYDSISGDRLWVAAHCPRISLTSSLIG